ncbi:hypothetical protein BW723_02670 [Polaribacter reichenbachii]|uniref:Uncharacterized protein n=1 Tax=Polaribacter reichenbachii TaxID=996801 RepID=A0A1B8TW69_9FLAO|nr:hypothetical protein [Polaribacter reichenbachii]APZ45266.1 hypothetical protein BW723_02670 [Polaribacter reichenbachii]AUC19129.1 hypothetical protein BTO17_10675 [Polaribacter reichenbachii]OBY63715.1 hypothetical protein LPB301_13030 [Polaribacter reichenbachii]
MKSPIIKLCFLFVFTLLIVSCNAEKSNPDKEDLSCYSNNKRPSQAITYKEMASMFNEYDNGQKILLDKYITQKSKGKDTVATVSEFFSIDELKQYIAYIEKISREKDIKLTGVKIFTAAYPSDYKIEAYQNRVSFILMPTTNIGDDKNVAYEPLKSTKGKPVSMQSVLHKYAGESTKKVNRASILSFRFMQEDDDSSALNRGSIDPKTD